MPDDPSQLSRRLKAVLLADIKDYSAAMGMDEVAAVAGIHTIRRAFEQVVPAQNGVFETTGGDTFLALFESASQAVQAAVDIQTRLANRTTEVGATPFRIRIGIHMGDVFRTSFEQWMGHAIDISARLQTLAPPGGVAISDDVYRAVRNRLAVPFADTGMQQLKNVAERIRVYAWTPAAPAFPALGTGATGPAPTLTRRALVMTSLSSIAGAAGWYWWTHRFPTAPGGALGGSTTIGVMQIVPQQGAEAWVGDFTRDALNTVLSKAGKLRVYSKQKIDFLREKRGMSEIEAAEHLGIEKMISGAIRPVGSGITLELQVIDIRSGLLEYSKEVFGEEDKLVEIQNLSALELVQALGLGVDLTAFGKVLQDRMKEDPENYRMLTDTMGSVTTPSDPSSRPRRDFLEPLRTPMAWAQEPDEVAIRGLLDRYRQALEAESLDRLAPLHVEFTDKIRDAFVAYFATVKALKVEFADLDIDVAGDEALATFTRRDDFTDARTGSPVHFEVRLSSIMSKQDGQWRIRGLKKSA